MSCRGVRRFVRVDVLGFIALFTHASLIFTARVVFGAAVVVSSFARAIGELLGCGLRFLSPPLCFMRDLGRFLNLSCLYLSCSAVLKINVSPQVDPSLLYLSHVSAMSERESCADGCIAACIVGTVHGLR